MAPKQCSVCNRQFARTEHLTRHVRTHTSEKPFPCPCCSQTFSRTDMRTRHLRQHHPDESAQIESENGADGARKRAKTACDRCRKMKIRCRCAASATPAMDELTPKSLSTSALYPNELTAQYQPSGFDALQTLESDMDFFTGLDIPETVDWTFGSLLDDSFAFPPLDNFYTSAFQAGNSTLPGNVMTALGIVEEYQQLKSGAATPSPEPSSPQKWFSEPPRPQKYDDEVINIFLDLACNHIGSTFKLFADFTLTNNTPTELYLALAAVGGLFCQVAGSFDVAKALYHDARRLLHASINDKTGSYDDVERNLSSCKTFLLLELYGYCSGDKRSYEFIEAFHTEMLQVIRKTSTELNAQSNDREREMFSILESLHILEGYRVVLMQRPATIPPYLTRLLYSGDHNDSSACPPSSTIVALFTPGCEAGDAAEHSSLALLSIISWTIPNVAPLAFGRVQPIDLWRAESAELALDTWLRQHRNASPPEMILFHMVRVSLHTDLELLQYFALAESNAQSGSEAENAGKDIRDWHTSPHYAVAKWNSARILLHMQSFPHDKLQEQKALGFYFGEPLGSPHVAYCVYYATLVLWCGSVLAKEAALTNALHLRTGISILATLKVRIGKVLCHALQEILH